MSLRLIECSLPEEAATRVLESIDRSTVLGAWCIEQTNGTQLLRVLADTERTEELVDRFEEELSLDERSRIFLVEVLATLPEPETEEDGDDGDVDEDEEEERPPERVAAIELSTKLRDSVDMNVNFVVMVAMSAIVASIGLMKDDTAVVIGAMVIAPLLSPNIALALGTTLSDTALLKLAAKAAVATIAIGLIVSFVIGLLIPFDPTVETLASRAEIGPGNIALALAAGVAGALAFTTGVSEGIVGVMVAVALLPALAAAGLLAGAGEWNMAGRASLLFAANVCGLNLAAIGTFLSQGLRPDFLWKKDEEEANKKIAAGVIGWTVVLVLIFASILYLEWF